MGILRGLSLVDGGNVLMLLGMGGKIERLDRCSYM
jgi:hypothetical protein